MRRKLIARWMWNVNAMRRWQTMPSSSEPPPDEPDWWCQDKEDQSAKHMGQYEDVAQKYCFSQDITDFVGQGRQIGYNGLAFAVLVSVYDGSHDGRRVRKLDEIVDNTMRYLDGRRPASWWALSLTSLALVWLEIGMAVMISYNIPTVGVGCRSMSYLIYCGLSTLPWLINVFPWRKPPGLLRKVVCHIFCGLSTLSLVFITFAAVSLCPYGFPRLDLAVRVLTLRPYISSSAES